MRLEINDHVSVIGKDGREYFGQVMELVGKDSFVLKWLAPKKGHLNKAKIEGRRLLPSDFRTDATLYQTTESRTCVKCVFYSSALLKHDVLFNDIIKFVPVEREQMHQLYQSQQLSQDSNVSTQDYVEMIAMKLSSHVNLFYSMFGIFSNLNHLYHPGKSFQNWIQWMATQNQESLSLYLIQLFEKEYFAFQNTLVNNTLPIESHSKNYSLFYKLFTNHFCNSSISTPISERINALLEKACNFTSTVGLNPKEFGACPFSNLRNAQYYTFHLKQLCRLCIVAGQEKKKRGEENSFISLIDKEYWFEIYSPAFPLSKPPSESAIGHHQRAYQMLELLVCGVVSKMMHDFLVSVLGTIGDCEDGDSKRMILEFFQWKFMEESRQRWEKELQ